MKAKFIAWGAIVIEKKKRYAGKRVAPPKKNKKKRAGKKKNTFGRIVLFVLLGVVALGLAVGCLFKFGSTVYPNVTVCGADVGGMGRDVAVRTVTSASSRIYGTQPLTMTLPDRTLTIRPEVSQVSVNASAAVADALAYGREGGPISCLIRWLQCRKTSYAVDVADSLQYDKDALRDLTGTVARDVESVKKQPSVSFDKEAGVVTVVNGTSARHLDPDALLDAILAAYSEGNFTGASFDYEVDPFDPVDLTPLWKENCTAAVDASYDEDTHEITPEKPGFGFDLEKEQQRVAQAAEGETLTITLQEFLPEVTVDTLEEKLFPDVLASYDSPHTAIAARTSNLIHACGTIDGMILNPGEVFSFNKTVGERTEANGYKPAIVYSTGGKSEMELGGGVCQVASTIYLCALIADLDVVQREEHMYAPTYVPFGMDATVYWGSLDFKFRNSTASPLRIRASVSDGYVHIKLLGVKTSKETIKMTYNTLATIPWQEVEEVDDTKPADYREVTQTPYTGYRVQTFKNYYDENGELLRTEPCEVSSYRKRDKIITVGKPEEEPAETPTEPTNPETPVTPAEPSVPAGTASDTPTQPTEPVQPAEPSQPPAEPAQQPQTPEQTAAPAPAEEIYVPPQT